MRKRAWGLVLCLLYSTRSQSALFDAPFWLRLCQSQKKCSTAWQAASALFFRLPRLAQKCAVKNAHILTALSIANLCLANGLWIRAPSEATEHPRAGFVPDFLLLKLGAFSSDGFFSPKWNSSQLEALCHKKAKAGAWVTHRLSADEILSPKAGTKLARNLSVKFQYSCFFQVELDIEPLRSAPPWLPTFLRSVRMELKQDYRLSLAIPPVYEKPLSGLSWKSEEAKLILEEVDGLDLMNYDTGCNTRQCYLEVLQSVFAFARSVVEQTPKKFVLLGFPAYKDRTKKHLLEIENLDQVLLALQNIKEPKFLCTKHVRFAYYAGWTMDGEDGKNMLRIQKWRENVCKN